jgi:hypothetical protein
MPRGAHPNAVSALYPAFKVIGVGDRCGAVECVAAFANNKVAFRITVRDKAQAFVLATTNSRRNVFHFSFS